MTEVIDFYNKMLIMEMAKEDAKDLKSRFDIIEIENKRLSAHKQEVPFYKMKIQEKENLISSSINKKFKGEISYLKESLAKKENEIPDIESNIAITERQIESIIKSRYEVLKRIFNENQ